MARIPYNKEVQGTLNAQGLPQQSSGVTKEMVSAETGFGKLMGVAGDAVQKFAIARQGKLDLEEYESTNAAYKTWESERKIGAYGQKMHQAKNIFASEKKVMDDWTNGDGSSSHLAFKEKYEAMSDKQKLRMSTAITVRQPDYMNAVGMHQSQQTDLAVIDSSKSSLGAAFTAYAIAATDQESLRELRSIDSSVEAIGAVDGWSSERIAMEKVVQRSTAHEARVSTMLSIGGLGTAVEAERYMKEFSGELTTASRVTINKQIRIYDVNEQAKVLSGQAMTMDPDALPAFFAKIKDSDVYTSTLSHYHKTRALHGNATTAAKIESNRAIGDWLRSAPPGQNSISNVPVGMRKHLANLSESDIEGFEAYELKLAGGGPLVTNAVDSATQDEVSQLLRTPAGVQKFLGLEIGATYANTATIATINKLRTKQESLGKGDNSLITLNQRIQSAMQGGDSDDGVGWSGPDFAQHRGITETKFYEKVDQFVSKNKRNPEGAEITALVKETLTAGHYKKMQQYNPKPDAIVPVFTATQRLDNTQKSMKWTDADHRQKIGSFRKLASARIEAAQRKALSGGKEWTTVMENKIMDTVARDNVKSEKSFMTFDILMPDSGGSNDSLIYAETVEHPELYPHDSLYVEYEGKKIYIKDLEALPDEKKAVIGKMMDRGGFRNTWENAAQLWFNAADAKSLQDVDINKQGVIRNPGGKEQTTIQAIREMVADESPNELRLLRDAQKKYGPVALWQYDMMAISKLMAHEDSDKLTAKDGIVADVRSAFGNEGLEYYARIADMRLKRERDTIK